VKGGNLIDEWGLRKKKRKVTKPNAKAHHGGKGKRVHYGERIALLQRVIFLTGKKGEKGKEKPTKKTRTLRPSGPFAHQNKKPNQGSSARRGFKRSVTASELLCYCFGCEEKRSKKKS